MTYRYSQVVYQSQLVNIGLFDCPKTAPNFNDTGPITGYLIAFPRTAVKIRHREMKEAFAADPTITTIYNPGQEYERYPLSTYGDRCDWMTLCPSLVLDTLLQFNLKPPLKEQRLFPVSYTESPIKSYQQFRQIILYLQHCANPDALWVEETAMQVFESIVGSAFKTWRLPQSSHREKTQARHHTIAVAANEILSKRFLEPLSLDSLAQALNCSVFHLCRIYKQHYRTTIYKHVLQLRLRHALSLLDESDANLTHLSSDLGFSDHSHFSYAFRHAYNWTPSRFRRWLKQLKATK